LRGDGEKLKILWRKQMRGQYQAKNPHPQYIAEVFIAPRGYQWAWGVWYERGTESGIAMTFRAAKDRCEEVIEKLTTSKRDGG
jgi:hypothetical protein